MHWPSFAWGVAATIVCGGGIAALIAVVGNLSD